MSVSAAFFNGLGYANAYSDGCSAAYSDGYPDAYSDGYSAA